MERKKLRLWLVIGGFTLIISGAVFFFVRSNWELFSNLSRVFKLIDTGRRAEEMLKDEAGKIGDKIKDVFTARLDDQGHKIDERLYHGEAVIDHRIKKLDTMIDRQEKKFTRMHQQLRAQREALEHAQEQFERKFDERISSTCQQLEAFAARFEEGATVNMKAYERVHDALVEKVDQRLRESRDYNEARGRAVRTALTSLDSEFQMLQRKQAKITSSDATFKRDISTHLDNVYKLLNSYKEVLDGQQQKIASLQKERTEQPAVHVAKGSGGEYTKNKKHDVHGARGSETGISVDKREVEQLIRDAVSRKWHMVDGARRGRLAYDHDRDVQHKKVALLRQLLGTVEFDREERRKTQLRRLLDDLDESIS